MKKIFKILIGIVLFIVFLVNWIKFTFFWESIAIYHAKSFPVLAAAIYLFIDAFLSKNKDLYQQTDQQYSPLSPKN